MCRLILFLMGALCVVAANAQPPFTDGPPYPVAGTTADLTKFEYFIDIDPGFGNGISALVTGQDASNISALVNINSLPRGVHQLFIRTFDVDKKWSLTNAVTFENMRPDYSNVALASNLSNLEYFIDTDPGFGLANPIGVTPSVDVTIPTAIITLGTLTPGVHQLFIRSKDATKHWSITNTSTFENLRPSYAASPVTSNIVKLEYFIKTDLGFENGTAIPVNPSANINSMTTTIDITAATPVGIQTLLIRSKDNLGRWGITNFATFDNTIFVYPPRPCPLAQHWPHRIFYRYGPWFWKW